jgi:hypothetical protein
LSARFSQTPTLGEFIARANHFGYTKHTIRLPERRAKIVYAGATVFIMDARDPSLPLLARATSTALDPAAA